MIKSLCLSRYNQMYYDYPRHVLNTKRTLLHEIQKNTGKGTYSIDSKSSLEVGMKTEIFRFAGTWVLAAERLFAKPLKNTFITPFQTSNN